MTRATLVSAALAWGVLITAVALAAGPRPRIVRLESTPPGATVRLDVPGAEPLGATPLRRAKVPGGPQTFVFRLEGYEEQKLTVDVKRWGQKIAVVLQKAAILDVTAGDEATFGASLSIDGVMSGRVPQKREVPPGRHLLEVFKEGRAQSQQWVTVERGQVLAVSLMVGGSVEGGLLVTSDHPGAEVWVDGALRGTAPMVWEDAPAGKLAVEVRAPGRPPFRITAEVVAGKRTVVQGLLDGSRGGLKVSTDAQGAEVWVDGTRLGVAPTGSDELAPGEHLLEVAASGYMPLSETVTVEPGHRRLLVVKLEPRLGEPVGAVIVDAQPPSATVTVDGRDHGGVPAYVRGLLPGDRTVVIKAEGHAPVTTLCRIAPGKDCRISANLVPGGERLVVRSKVEGGSLYADGALLGPLPYDGGIAPGAHELEARAPNHTSWMRAVTVTAGQPAGVYDANLEELRPEKRGVFVHSADIMPPRRMALDLSAGWVPLAEVRFDVGIISFLDAGFAIRTFGRLTELEARAKAAYRFLPLLSAGVQVRTGGGFGPDDIDSGFFLVEVLGSVHIEPRVAITLLFATDIYSDDYPFAETDSDVPAAASGRQSTIGFRFGGNVELAITDMWNIWAGIEWTAARSESRRILGDLFGDGSEASNLWFRLGATVKF